MNSLILRIAVTILKPLLLVFSLLLLLQGHQSPGGGFVGGLLAASAFVFHALAHGTASARKQLRAEPHLLIGSGLLLAAGSGLFQMAGGLPFMTGIWLKAKLFSGWTLEIGTPFLFDVGVYLVVLGTALLIFFNLKEE